MSEVPAGGYTHLPAFDDGYLSVSDLHKIYFQQFGRPDGKPVIFLHGGPGGSCGIHKSTAFFDPEVYRVVCVDQRGAGRSLPLGELREFSPDNLVADIDSLRKHLGIGKWHMVFGGSWGSTLALRYAQAHAADVGSLVLRGIYFETHEEHRFSRGREGVGRLRPEEYDEWAGHLPAEDRHDPLPGYLKLLTCGDKEIELAAAKAYERYNSVIGQLIVPPGKSPGSDDSIWSHARIECYHHVKFARPDYEHFLGRENIEKVKHIPLTIVQGRYDIICTPRVAYELHKAWLSSRLFWIDAAGHSQNEPGTFAKLKDVCDEYKRKTFS